jgi:hypothetical protein
MCKCGAIEKVIAVWRSERIKLLPPEDEAVILTAMKQIDRPVSRDVVNLYMHVGGFEDSTFDSHLWSFWSLAYIVQVHRSYTRPYILFADYLIDSHRYCFHYENAQVSSVYIDYGPEQALVAPTVEEFFHLYLTDRKSLLIF